MDNVATFFHNYIGTGLVLIFYVAALVYLFVTEKRKERRVIFVYSPLAVLLLFFNPWIAKLIQRLSDEETYFRMMWLLPVTLTLVYAAVVIFCRFTGWKRIAAGVLAGVLFAGGGSLVYLDEGYSKAENLYHAPQVVVDLCETMHVEGREVMAAFPVNLIEYVRQVDVSICMPYGRDMFLDARATTDLAELMKKQELPAKELSSLAGNCHYVILTDTQRLLDENGALQEKYADCLPGFSFFREVDGYQLYRSNTLGFGLESGWVQNNGDWYFFDGGRMLTGWMEQYEVWYYFNEEGILQTGWTKIGKNWYFMSDEGIMQLGWLAYEGNTYYLKDGGKMATGWNKIDGNWYWFSSAGVMKTGWMKEEGKWYYFGKDGIMAKGWLSEEGKTYYLNASGVMAQKESLIIDGVQYDFGPDGALIP